MVALLVGALQRVVESVSSPSSATLWRVAWGTPDRRIDPNRFRALVALMNQADAAIGKGELKLNPG